MTFIVTNCLIPEGCPSPNVPPGDVAILGEPSSASGVVLDVVDAPRVSASVRIFSSPSGSTYTGAELPTASESDFTNGSLEFMALPIGHGGRTRELRSHLRVYSLEPGPVRIRVEAQGWYTVSGPIDEAHEFDLDAFTPPAPAAYAFIDLAQNFPRVVAQTTFENVTVTPLRRPDGTTPRIWGFVTLTSGGTNHVSVVTPR